jgi:C4-dicarboxylate transporter DctM subunit
VGVIMLVIAAAQMYSWALVAGQIPQSLTGWLLGVTENPLIILLLINILLLVIGSVMEGNSALIVFVPILLPVATAVGIDPVHLGLILVVNLGIGLLTPPVGMCLLVAAKIGKITVNQAIPAMLPWFGICIAFLAGITYLPVMFGWF